MYYVVTDLKGNTPLLLAVQPSNNLTKEEALQLLKQRMEAGTLVITRRKGEAAVLRGQVQGEESESLFVEVTTKLDVNLGCDLLGISREELVATLQSLKKSEQFREIRTKLARDIVEQFVLDEFMINDKFKSRLEYYREAVLLLDELTRKINQTLLPDSEELYSGQEILKLHEENKIRLVGQTLKKLKTAIHEVDKYYQQLLTYCSETQVYTWYVKQLLNTSVRIGTNAITLYACAHNLPFCVWKKEEGVLNLLANTQQPDAQRNTIHLLSNGSYFDYTVLYKLDQNYPEEMFCAFTLEKKVDYLNEVNDAGQNLLHLAVQHPLCDVLVPFLLDRCQFKTKIKTGDSEGNSALHLAVAYFYENYETLSELDISEYYRLIATSFTALLLAGSDLTLVNDRKQNVCQLAAYYEERELLNPFKATLWLTSLSMCRRFQNTTQQQGAFFSLTDSTAPRKATGGRTSPRFSKQF